MKTTKSVLINMVCDEHGSDEDIIDFMKSMQTLCIEQIENH